MADEPRKPLPERAAALAAGPGLLGREARGPQAQEEGARHQCGGPFEERLAGLVGHRRIPPA